MMMVLRVSKVFKAHKVILVYRVSKVISYRVNRGSKVNKVSSVFKVQTVCKALLGQATLLQLLMFRTSMVVDWKRLTCLSRLWRVVLDREICMVHLARTLVDNRTSSIILMPIRCISKISLQMVMYMQRVHSLVPIRIHQTEH